MFIGSIATFLTEISMFLGSNPPFSAPRNRAAALRRASTGRQPETATRSNAKAAVQLAKAWASKWGAKCTWDGWLGWVGWVGWLMGWSDWSEILVGYYGSIRIYVE